MCCCLLSCVPVSVFLLSPPGRRPGWETMFCTPSVCPSVCVSVCPSGRYQLISATVNPVDAKLCTNTPWIPTMNLCPIFSRTAWYSATRRPSFPCVCRPSVRYQLISATVYPVDAKLCTHTLWIPKMNLCPKFSRTVWYSATRRPTLGKHIFGYYCSRF